ncbi:MAG: TolC family protein, partial [Zoogloeaceae bacterium]|nr:TolC family protein [Zoogloeaceae bacterium]
MKPRFARRWSWLALLPLTLAACTVGPDYKLPDEALINAPLAHAPLDPVGAPVSTATALSGDWWRLYDDPVLNELIEAALRSNTDLRIAAANLARSRAALAVAEAQGGFEGGASAQFLRAQDSAEQHLLASKLEPDNMGDVGLSISYEIDLFGKLRRVVEAARADDEAVEAAQDLARIAVVSDVVRAYVGSCSAGEELAIAKESFKLQQERVALVRQLRDAGRGNQTEVT